MEAVQRMVPLESGKRTGVRLDQPTWNAIEWLAEQSGKSWQQWCAKVITSTPSDENTTASIRAAAMEGMLAATIFEDRRNQLAAMESHPLMRNSATLNDKQLEGELESAMVQGWSDFGGFAVGFGHDSFGQDCVWIKNGLRNGLHFAFAYPLSDGGGK